MNTRNSKDVDPIFILILIGAGAIVVGIYKLGETLGLDFQTTLSVVGRTALALTVVGVCIWFGILHFSETWPLLIGTLYIAWWPAMNVWAAHPVLSFDSALYETVWWNAWYTRVGVLAACIALWLYLRSRD